MSLPYLHIRLHTHQVMAMSTFCHLQMGLHVFFGCYFNLFRLMAKCGVLENLLLKEHTHTFCNNNGDVRELDFRFFINGQKIGAPFHGTYVSQQNSAQAVCGSRSCLWDI